MQLNVFCKKWSWHTISVKQYEDIRLFHGRIFSPYLLWALLCQHSSPQASYLSDLRASWHHPPNKSQIFNGDRLFIDSVFPDWLKRVSFPRSPEVLAHLWFPRAFASFFLLPPQHPPHFLPLRLLALFSWVCVFLLFFHPNIFVFRFRKIEPMLSRILIFILFPHLWVWSLWFWNPITWVGSTIV